MPSARTRPLLERLWMACVALLFLLQPIALAGAGCSLRAELSGGSCCCAKAEKPAPKPSCCAKRAGHDAPARAPAPKKCGCGVSAPPLVPPGSAAELPQFLGELARLSELPLLPLVACELPPAPPRAQAPPGRAGCFHACLCASLARALAFERTLRC